MSNAHSKDRQNGASVKTFLACLAASAVLYTVATHCKPTAAYCCHLNRVMQEGQGRGADLNSNGPGQPGALSSSCAPGLPPCQVSTIRQPTCYGQHLHNALPCAWYPVPCCAMLCCAVQHCAVLTLGYLPQHTVLQHAMLCYAMLCYAMLCYATLCYATLC